MKEMWNVPGRVKPTVLEYDAILDGSFVLPDVATKGKRPAAGAAPQPAAGPKLTNSNAVAGLKDQRELSLKDNVILFEDRWVPLPTPSFKIV